MHVSLEGYGRASRALVMRALLWLGGGTVLGVVGFLGTFLGYAIIVAPNNPQLGAGIVCMLVTGLLPSGVAIAMITRGARAILKRRRLRALSLVARQHADLDAGGVAHHLDLTRHAAERLILEASTEGVVVDGPPGAAPVHPAIAPTVAPGNAAPGTVTPGNVAPDAMPPTRIPAIGASSDLTGAILNDTYAVEALLGHGGMGAVYRARHTRTGRAYAVKVLLPDARRSLHGIERFKREASAVSALGHEGIVSVHDFHQTTDGVHYLVMDLLSGETLGQHLAREGTLPWPVARRIALEVASALQAAHDAGVVHRDLKPHNVFLARRSAGEPRAVLLDFGLAKPMEDVALTESGVPVGTPLYMSPEQARGEPVDARTDVYALGTLVYEMLSGAPPFSEAVLARVYARLLDEPAPPVSRAAVRPCPSGLDEILTRALAKDREARYASAAELAADLLALPSL